MKSNKIFIQIASYRDNQLLFTIKDCIKNSHQPENLVFCIAWQHCVDDKWDSLDEYQHDNRFKIINIDYKDSEGVCWARHLIQQYYDNEEFTLQLDSHHRFIPNWDKELITMIRNLQSAGYKKPLLTAYLPPFQPDKDPDERQMYPCKLNFDKFTPEGVVFFLPAKIDNFESLTSPIRCRFYSAHFCFTLGIFCKEVQHDPKLYFHGEEISIAVRAFTWGYDLFSPHKIIAWHEYTRKYRTKHWDDAKDWFDLNAKSHIRLRKLFGIDAIENNIDMDFGKYGFGPERSLSDYEKYAGICFKTRSVQQYTVDNESPPNPITEADTFTKIFKYSIDVDLTDLPYNDYLFFGCNF